ncbi:MAG: DUF732 domain-containing protein [Mycobacteriaceae bacterium]|uniref:DUF732 domain-containing protein n=1 Tax=Corynebacterium sp. TaxID=1720 RepID=UPI003F954773
MSALKKMSLAAAGMLFAGSLAACGGDSTVDNDSTDVPSVASDAGSTEGSATSAGSDAPDTSASAAPSEDEDPAADNGGDPSPQDGEVEEVDPQGEAAPRTGQDDAFLSQLKDNGIDVEDSDIEDQIIASGHEQCLANDEGRDSFAVPMIAGQLEVQGITDVDPEEAGRIIAEAAEAHYCG